MRKWIDIKPQDWFYKDVIELTDVKINGEPFFAGINYNTFKDNKEAIDISQPDVKIFNKNEIYLNTVVVPTEDNPIVVYVNGLIVSVDEIQPLTDKNQTYIKLSRAIKSNSDVRVIYAGEPKFEVKSTDFNGTPVYDSIDKTNVVGTLAYNTNTDYIQEVNNFYEVWFEIDLVNTICYIEKNEKARLTVATTSGDIKYPKALIDVKSAEGETYLYDPFNGYSSEVVTYMGKQLRRVEFEESEETKFEFNDEYTIRKDSDGKWYIEVPYILNNQLITIDYLILTDTGIIKTKREELIPSSDCVLYNNRFFPNIKTSKAEFIASINNLRIALTNKYTDTEAWRSTKSTSRFDDVQAYLDDLSSQGKDEPWWWWHLRDIEELKLTDGSFILQGKDNNNLAIDNNITRAELVSILDNFRVWFIETFK